MQRMIKEYGIGERVCVEVLEARRLLTVTLAVSEEVSAGSAGWVRVSSDAPATDLPKGTRYSYDLNGDGRFEVRNSKAAERTISKTYLKTLGTHTVTVRVMRPGGVSTDYQTQITVYPPMDWFPHMNGMGLSYAGTDGGQAATWNVTLSDAKVSGKAVVLWHAEEHGASEQTVDDYLAIKGTRTSLIRETDANSSGSVVSSFGRGMPWWDFSRETSWSGVTGSIDLGGHSGRLKSSGTIDVLGVAPLTLSNGLYFPEALSVRRMDGVVMTDGQQSRGLQATTTTWFVRGIGVVQEISSKVRVSAVNGVSSLPERMQYTMYLASAPSWARPQLMTGDLMLTGAVFDTTSLATTSYAIPELAVGAGSGLASASLTGSTLTVNANPFQGVGVNSYTGVTEMTLVWGGSPATLTGSTLTVTAIPPYQGGTLSTSLLNSGTLVLSGSEAGAHIPGTDSVLTDLTVADLIQGTLPTIEPLV